MLAYREPVVTSRLHQDVPLLEWVTPEPLPSLLDRQQVATVAISMLLQAQEPPMAA
jgi:hypothetical protein